MAYAMSRLDSEYLRQFKMPSWKAAFSKAATCLGVPPTSMKNLRDEFDPVHPNPRKGWHKRPLRPNRHRVLGMFSDISDNALIEIVSQILDGDQEVAEVISKPLAVERTRVENVAERLRTGRLAEEYFMEHSHRICGVQPDSLIDMRQLACGFDFSISDRPLIAIEVKGMKGRKGEILFTDYEWNVAHHRQSNYWLVVVGCVDERQSHRLVQNPVSKLAARVTVRTATSVSWRTRIAV